MATALELIAQKKAELAALEASAANEIAAAKRGTMDEILNAMKEDKITLQELSLYARTIGSKYSNGTDTWSGKGKQPAWLAKAIAEGKKLEDFLTVKPQAPAAE